MNIPLFRLYNHYTKSYLQIDTTTSNFGLSAFKESRDSLLFELSEAISDTEEDRVKFCTSVNSTPYCLDAREDNKTVVPYLASPANTTGQQWFVRIGGGGTLQLSNVLTGNGSYLGVYSNPVHRAFMGVGDDAGKYWKPVLGNGVASLSSRRSTPTDAPAALASQIADSINSQVAGIVNSAFPTTPTTPPSIGNIPSDPNSSSDQVTRPPGTPKFSSAAKAGIGGGCALLLVVVGALIFYLLFWKNRDQGTKRKIPSSAADQNRNVRPEEKGFDMMPKPVYVRTVELPSPTHEQQIREGWTTTGQPVEVDGRSSYVQTVQGTTPLGPHGQGNGVQTPGQTFVHELPGQHAYRQNW